MLLQIIVLQRVAIMRHRLDTIAFEIAGKLSTIRADGGRSFSHQRNGGNLGMLWQEFAGDNGPSDGEETLSNLPGNFGKKKQEGTS